MQFFSPFRSSSTLLTCSLCALQNLISVLPVDKWGSPASPATMWSFLFALLEKSPDPGAVSGVLVILLHRIPALVRLIPIAAGVIKH